MANILKDPRALPPLPEDPKDWDKKLLSKVCDECLESLDSPIWSAPSVDAKTGTSIYVNTPTEKEPLCRTKTVAVVNVGPREVCEFLVDVDNWMKHKLDAGQISGRQVQRTQDGQLRLQVGEWSLGWPIWPREFLWLAGILQVDELEQEGGKKKNLSPGTLVVVSQSVQSHGDVALRESEVVRGIIVADVVVAEPLEGGKRCRLTKITSVDPLGWIPSAVINLAAKQNAAVVDVAKKVLESLNK